MQDRKVEEYGVKWRSRINGASVYELEKKVDVWVEIKGIDLVQGYLEVIVFM